MLINNAGIIPFDDVSRPIDDGVTRAILETNLLGPFRMVSGLIEHLKRQPRATIINNTSMLAYGPLASNAVYSAAKAALHSFTLSLRFMLRDTTVRVQEIAPPWVNTDLVRKTDEPRAMPLDAFITETMRSLESEAPELLVESVKPLRDNPGSEEHALVDLFNTSMVENPIPL